MIRHQLALLLLTASAALCQSRTAEAPIFPNLPAHEIGPKDLLSISVYDAPELTRTVRVGDDGFIRLPMLKRRLNAVGRLPAQLESDIAAALESEQILVAPVVTVGVAEYQSRPISVAGAVKTPITFQAFGQVTLLEALSRAGGLNESAGSEILVTRKQTDGAAVPAIRIPVKQLIDAADPAANLSLHGGEEIRIPEAGRVFVVGNVKKPGTFAMQDGAESSVLKALALAEGLMPFAAKEGFIYRREATGSKNEIKVELRKILDRKQPDVALLANDVLYIPDNRGKRLGVAALEKALMFGTTAGATALIYSGR